MLKLAVFVSGRGSNLQAVAASIDQGRLDASIAVVLSNRSDAPALQWAVDRGIPAHSLQTIAPEENAAATIDILLRYEADFIVLAGYLKLIPAEVVARYRHRILNIHPALLPSFGGPGMYGRNVHQAVLRSGVKVSGATVHLVDEEYDRGPIVIQRCVPVKGDDTPESLAARILELEHVILPEALQLFAENRVVLDDQRAIVKERES